MFRKNGTIRIDSSAGNSSLSHNVRIDQNGERVFQRAGITNCWKNTLTESLAGLWPAHLSLTDEGILFGRLGPHDNHPLPDAGGDRAAVDSRIQRASYPFHRPARGGHYAAIEHLALPGVRPEQERIPVRTCD